ncbi:hypothetical protein [Streptomyces fagopyri]|uniref:hypothetical protein n=1 Tax=Streptomyces fagopyri TaxID=2662397 RepID=UPI0034067728
MTTDAADRHPLAYLLAVRATTAEAYLHRVAAQHQCMGYEQMAYRKEKASRWIAGVYAPSYHTQLAVAALENIPPEAIHAHGWPGWLLLALPDHALFLPWTSSGTVQALEITGGPVDRRKFLITTSVTRSATVAQWSAAAPAGAAPTAGNRIGGDVPDHSEKRLESLRRLDDTVGSGDVYDAARTELTSPARRQPVPLRAVADRSNSRHQGQS